MADPSYIVDGVLTDGEAWVALFSTTLGSDTASITFTSTDDGQVGDFSQYMDLVAICYLKSAHANDTRMLEMTFNGDNTAANYAVQRFVGNGSTVAASTTAEEFAAQILIAGGAGANIFQAVIVNYHDINSGKFKTALIQSAGDWDSGAPDPTAGEVEINAFTWKSQAAVTSVLFRPDSGNFLAASRIDLFGVLPRMVSA
jgi:hypothetical protein